MIGWLDPPEIFAIIAIAGSVIQAWRHEKREAREDARRGNRVDEVERKCDRAESQIDGYLAQIADLEIRIRKLEG